jgi:ribosomal protein L44E
MAKQFKIPLRWDGSSKFHLTDTLTKKDIKLLLHLHLKSWNSYDPSKLGGYSLVKCMVTTRNHEFNWSWNGGAKSCTVYCIYAKRFSSKNAKSWVEWANSHFKRVQRLFCRLEHVYGITSSSHVQHQNKPLVKMPELVCNSIRGHVRHMSKKWDSQN